MNPESLLATLQAIAWANIDPTRIYIAIWRH